jgi:hypothetical protein
VLIAGRRMSIALSDKDYPNDIASGRAVFGRMRLLGG